MLTFATMLMLAAGAAAQDDVESALRKARDAREKAERLLKGFDDATVVGFGGGGGAFRLMISCRDAAALDEARKRLGGDAVDGVPILWSFRKAAPPPEAKPVPLPEPAPAQPPKPEPLPKGAGDEPPWKASITDCDIIRDHLKLKPIEHPIGNGRFRAPCQLIQRSVIGAGGGHTYLFTKHRDECPIRLGRVAQPPWADNFVAWVFQKGITPAQRGGFLSPFELRADDKFWDQQATEEMKGVLQYIREGAEWTRSTGAYMNVRSPWFSGSVPTGGSPGLGWTWSQPMTPLNLQPPVPLPQPTKK